MRRSSSPIRGQDATQLDLTTTVTTPEHVRFDYRLAGLSQRLMAFLIDLIIRVSVFLFIVFLVICSGIVIRSSFLVSTSVALSILLFFAMSQFYGVFLETYWNGQTLGKRLLSIRVVMINGQPINGIAALVRNLCRTADIMPVYLVPLAGIEAGVFPVPLFLFSIVLMSILPNFQRLGDVAANTIVITQEPKLISRASDFRDPKIEDLALQFPPDLIVKASLIQSLALYIDRRNYLGVSQREDLCGILIEALSQRYNLPSGISNDLLVCALHYREFYLKDEKFEMETA